MASAMVAYGLLAFFPQPAAADKGVAVSLGRIELSRPLERGRSYTLPTLSVINPGDERSEYRLGVSHIADQAQRRVPAEWLEFSEGRLALPPGQSKPVSIRLQIPTAAEPGQYQALLEAAMVGEGGQGASVGAAAAARLTFEIKPSGWFDSQWNRVKDLLAELSPWPQLVVLLAGAAGAWWWLSRRFTISVGRRP